MLYLGSKGYTCTSLYVNYIKMINNILELGSYIEDVLYPGSRMYKSIGISHNYYESDIRIVSVKK